jgi:hypothetical protein
MLRGAFKLKLGAGVLGLALTAMLLVSLASPSFAFAAVRPVVSHVSPTSGSTVGGNTVTITGSHFTVGGRSNVQYVAFARYTATHLSVKSTSRLVVRAPAHHAGIVNVLVYNRAGQHSSVSYRDKYTYRTSVPVAADMITAFSFVTPAVNGTITGTNIAVTVPNGTDVTALVPAITVSAGATVSPASGVAHNFTSPATYTVTSATGATQAYTVTVTVAPATFGITAFSFPVQAGVPTAINGTISGTSITVTVPYGTPITSLYPAITINGVSVSPAAGTPENFTSPVSYTVTSASGATAAYTVTVTVASATSDDAITYFAFTQANNTQFGTNYYGTISGTDITVDVPAGTVDTNANPLIPTITVSTGATVSPASGVGENFTSPVDYMVTAASGAKQIYTVTVVPVNPALSAITSVTIPGEESTHVDAGNATQWDILMPSGTNLAALVPTFQISPGATISPASGVVQNFSNGVVGYVVMSLNGPPDDTAYTLYVTTDQSASTAISSAYISIGGIDYWASISGSTLNVTVPAGTVLSTLVAHVNTVNPAATVTGFATPFTNGTPVAFTVTATTSQGATVSQNYHMIVTVGS